MRTESYIASMRCRMGLALCVLAFASVATAQSAQLDRNAPVAVRAWPKFMMPEAWVAVDVHVPAHPDNRAVQIVVESVDFYASSSVQLEGDIAPSLHRRRWNDLPPGAYKVRAILQRLNGYELRAIDSFVVAGERSRR